MHGGMYINVTSEHERNGVEKGDSYSIIIAACWNSACTEVSYDSSSVLHLKISTCSFSLHTLYVFQEDFYCHSQ